jgi:hypothetical protein
VQIHFSTRFEQEKLTVDATSGSGTKVRPESDEKQAKASLFIMLQAIFFNL